MKTTKTTTSSAEKTFVRPMTNGQFRNYATGVGNTAEVSERTGANRSAKVMEQARRCGKTDADLAAAGYTATMDTDEY